MHVGTRQMIVGLILGAIALVVPVSALAQDEASPWTMTVEIGIDGYVDPAQPMPVVVELVARELLVARLDVTSGGTTVRTDVEVPAGGVKQYVVEGAPPAGRTQVTVALVDPEADDQTLLSQQTRIRVPRDEILVGTAGYDAVAAAIRSAKPFVLERTVVPVAVDPAQLEAGPGVLSYLVISSDAAASLSPEAVERLAGWVRDGGRLYGPLSAVERVAPAGGGTIFPQTTVEITRFGDGEVGVVADPAALDVTEWSALLRPTPAVGLIRNEAVFNAPAALLSAASSGREASVPALPWLLGGILLFVVLVGPVNFLVLRSIGKPEWAWLTVPALSVAFVLGFWIVGRSQLQDFTATQAAVIVDQGDRVDGYAALVVQVEEGGRHELDLPPGWTAIPAAGGGSFPGTAVRRDDGTQAFEFEVEDLGVGAGQAQWRLEDSVAIDVGFADASNRPTVNVTNGTEWDFWTWGIVVNGVGFAANELLEAGQTSEIAVRAGVQRVIYEPVISEAVGRRGFVDELPSIGDRYSLVNSLGLFAEYRAADLRTGDAYFFGFTESMATEVRLDGRGGTAEGTTLVVKRIEPGAGLPGVTSTRPRLLDVVGASTVEGYFDEIYAYGADEVYFWYQVPPGTPGVGKVSPGFNTYPVVEVFDWENQAYIPIAWGQDFRFADYLSPAGELILRASTEEGNAFEGESIQLSRYQLTWSST